jgi:hypothetical protein
MGDQRVIVKLLSNTSILVKNELDLFQQFIVPTESITVEIFIWSDSLATDLSILRKTILPCGDHKLLVRLVVTTQTDV